MVTRRQRRVAFTRLTLRVSSCSTMAETVFLQALRDSGCILSVDDNDAPAVFGTSDIWLAIRCCADWAGIPIACEPVLFRRDLSIKIRSDAQYPNNLTIFFESMNDTLLDLDMFRRFLLPATLSEEARRSTRYAWLLQYRASVWYTSLGVLHSIVWPRHYYKWTFFKRISSITCWKDYPSFMMSWRTSKWQSWCMLHEHG